MLAKGTPQRPLDNFPNRCRHHRRGAIRACAVSTSQGDSGREPKPHGAISAAGHLRNHRLPCAARVSARERLSGRTRNGAVGPRRNCPPPAAGTHIINAARRSFAEHRRAGTLRRLSPCSLHASPIPLSAFPILESSPPPPGSRSQPWLSSSGDPFLRVEAPAQRRTAGIPEAW